MTEDKKKLLNIKASASAIINFFNISAGVVALKI